MVKTISDCSTCWDGTKCETHTLKKGKSFVKTEVEKLKEKNDYVRKLRKE